MSHSNQTSLGKFLLPLTMIIALICTAWAQTSTTVLVGGWKMAYEHDSAGNQVEGNLSNLIQAIRKGADVKIESGDAFFEMDQIELITVGGITHVGAQFLGLSLIDQYGPPRVRSTPYTAYQWVDTTGGNALARVTMGNPTVLSTGVGVVSLRWHVRVR